MDKQSAAHSVHCPAFPFQVMLQQAAEEPSFPCPLLVTRRSSQCFINHPLPPVTTG